MITLLPTTNGGLRQAKFLGQFLDRLARVLDVFSLLRRGCGIRVAVHVRDVTRSSGWCSARYCFDDCSIRSLSAPQRSATTRPNLPTGQPAEPPRPPSSRCSCGLARRSSRLGRGCDPSSFGRTTGPSALLRSGPMFKPGESEEGGVTEQNMATSVARATRMSPARAAHLPRPAPVVRVRAFGLRQTQGEKLPGNRGRHRRQPLRHIIQRKRGNECAVTLTT